MVAAGTHRFLELRQAPLNRVIAKQKAHFVLGEHGLVMCVFQPIVDGVSG